MTMRHCAAWFSGVALLATTATLLWAQPPQPAREGAVRGDRAKLRADVVRLRTEVEMLQFDYDVARFLLFEELKFERGLKMAGGFLQLGSAIQSAANEAGAQPPGEAPRQVPAEDRKKSAEAARAAELQEKKEAAEEAAALAKRKKELARVFTALAEKRLDLEDAERNYRAAVR
jgi:hypothetical protein